MKKSIFLISIVLMMCSSVFAQSLITEFEKIKRIKILESKRKDIKRILTDFESDSEEEAKKNEPIYSETFSNKIANVEISYSTGICSDKSDDVGEWNISKGKVTSIEVFPDKVIKLKDFKFDFSGFKKEQKYSNDKNLFVIHNKNLGIAFEVGFGEIMLIKLFPSNSYYSYLCENEESKDLKEFYSTESYFGNSKLKDRVDNSHVPARVLDVILSTNELKIGCDKVEVSVKVLAVDPQDDVLTFNYTVSGGKIVGKGAEVIWELWDTKPATYTITVGVDDGCGVCSETKTKKVVVKKCDK